ncbi:hypothetical protein [Streptomyces reniochalinae]
MIVYPPDQDGGRRVRCYDRILGRAHSLEELADLLADAGWTRSKLDLDGPLVEWRGGGHDVWHPDNAAG